MKLLYKTTVLYGDERGGIKKKPCSFAQDHGDWKFLFFRIHYSSSYDPGYVVSRFIFSLSPIFQLLSQLTLDLSLTSESFVSTSGINLQRGRIAYISSCSFSDYLFLIRLSVSLRDSDSEQVLEDDFLREKFTLRSIYFASKSEIGKL